MIEAVPPLPKVDSKEILQKKAMDALASDTCVPVSSLPHEAQEEYMKDITLKTKRFDFDFIGLKLSLGEKRFQNFLKDLAIVKKARRIRVVYADFGNVTQRLEELAHSHSMSLSTLERRETEIVSTELKKLIQPLLPTFRSKKMCYLTRIYVVAKLSSPNAPSNNMIRYELYNIAAERGKDICTNCCYREGSDSRSALSESDLMLCPACPVAGEGLIVPKGKDVFNRFVRSIDSQQLYMAQKGLRKWEDKYQHTCIRDKPTEVNEIWFGDHHIFDLTVAYKEQKGKIIYGRPWLTAITDAASDVVVGWVISVRPNRYTIAESFCRAAAFTMDSEIHGLCQNLYCDRGRDYCSMLIEGKDFKLRTHPDTHMYLNRPFFDNALLPALNVNMRHARGYRGRSKPIERLFGVFEKRYISQLPNYLGSSIDARPYDFSKELKHLETINGYLTMESFVRVWDEIILPDYHSNPYENTTAPMDRYRSLPKADTITPDWNTLAVFKTERPPHKVHQNGIHYLNDIYWNRALEPYVNKEVLIYDFDDTFYHKISVLYEDKFICEASPAIHYEMIETDLLKLQYHLAAQERQAKMVTQKIAKARYFANESGMKVERYMNTKLESIDEESLEPEPLFCYASAVDFDRDRSDATVLSSDASTLAQIHQQRMHEIKRLIDLSEDNNPLDDYYTERGKLLTSN